MCDLQISRMSYFVVEFMKRDEDSAVPNLWIRDNGVKCLWPPYIASAKLEKSMRSRELPGGLCGSCMTAGS